MRARQPDVGARLAGLRAAVDALDGVASTDQGAEALRRAHEVLAQVGQRRELSSAHTVVALAGATGSGKSSLVNALAGVEVATPGARRPTTADPLAVIWTGPDLPLATAGPLLDWLEVDRRHELNAAEAAWNRADVTGLVLLDLPDIDSVEIAHRRTADRLAKSVDVLVWVLDPQKYADAVVHADFLRPMAKYADITVVVLNQIDLLAEGDRPAVMKDLTQLLADDGLRGARVLGVSARSGEGLAPLRATIADFVRERRAADARLIADIATVAEALDTSHPADAPTALAPAVERQLVDALCAAAGVDVVAAAVAGSFRHRARAKTGWPLVRWLGRFRADPLRRLHLHRAVTGDGAAVATSSKPVASPVQRAQVQTALRSLGERAAGQAGEPWRSYIRSAATGAAETLPDALDQAVVRTDLDGRSNPRWFAAIGFLQWLVFAMFVAGALWLGVYAVLGYLRFEDLWVPQIGPVPADPPLPAFPAIPWPTALLVGGGVCGIVVAVLSSLAARVGARRRATRSRAALRRAIAGTARSRVLEPVQARVAHAGAFAAGIAVARGK